MLHTDGQTIDVRISPVPGTDEKNKPEMTRRVGGCHLDHGSLVLIWVSLMVRIQVGI